LHLDVAGFGASCTTVADPPSAEDLDAISRTIADDTAADFAVPRAEPGLILLIEDDFVLRISLAELLRSEGYRVEGAANGLEALTRLKNPPQPSLIVLDIMLPHMSGREFRSRQLAAPALAGIPLVVITAVGLSAEDRALLKPDRVFYKPLDTAAYLAALRELCSPVVS
jgi:CheY-like chemotaxis protein